MDNELFKIIRKLCAGSVMSFNKHNIRTDAYIIVFRGDRTTIVINEKIVITIRTTKRYYTINGHIRYPKTKTGERAFLDYLFVPTESPKSLILAIEQILPQPIAEEIIPEMCGLPLRYHFDKHIKDNTRYVV